jgi:L-2-hydroxyglutarate oxidase LhgO
MRTDFDFIIAGAGIIGISTSLALLDLDPALKILIAEKEQTLGAHASGRNSGVLHAGFYYSPDSLKAQFCRDGNYQLRKLISRYNIPIRDIGKVVVARSAEDVEALKQLETRGISNGVKVSLLNADELSRYEPLATTKDVFLWSPTTAVSDPKLILNAMAEDARARGVIIRLGAPIKFENGAIQIEGETLKYSHFINAVGAGSDRIAHQFGFANDYTMLPFMGLYRETSHDSIPISTLVYPAPHPINPFLGVHLTVTISGKVKIGPTAIPLLGREQYSLTKIPSFSDISDSLRGGYSLAKGKAHNLSRMISLEFPKFILANLVRDAATLVPMVSTVSRWKRREPGIRAQLVNLKSGELEQDFKIFGDSKSTHVLNVVSPGWTSAIPFGKHIADEAFRKFSS